MTGSVRKVFFWFIALILVMACAPSVAAPVPPLDPNAINTYIVQTVDAASTQTQEAIPPTLTFTPTLRSTFTPMPTYTNVPSIIFPTSTPSQRVQYFRVKHDNQLAEYNYKSRTEADDWVGVGLQTPEVVSLFLSQSTRSGTHRTVLNNSWEIFINALNGQDKRKLRYLKANNTALFDGKGFPYLESKTMGGNVITLVEIQGGWGRVKTIDFKSPGSLKDVTYVTNPDLIQKFVVVGWKKSTKSTYWVKPPPGDIYWPLVTDRDVWIPMERLEPFPILPMEVTAIKSQEYRKTPSLDGEKTGFEFTEGDTAKIVEYYPSGSNVWGRLPNGRWIALLLNWRYFTNWSMATLPPPP